MIDAEMDGKTNCDSCRFWEELGKASDVGECHRHAPHPMHRKELHYEVAFPVTSFLHWCGDHQPRHVRCAVSEAALRPEN